MGLFSMSQKWRGCRYDPTTVWKHINYSFLMSPVYRLLLLIISCIIQNICCWFFHSYNHGVYTLIKTIVLFIQRKKRTFKIIIIVINTEAAIPGQSKDLSNLTFSSWEPLISSPLSSFLHFDCLIPDCFCFITSCPSQPFDFLIFFSLLHPFPQRAQHLCRINKLSAFSRKKCNERRQYENSIYTWMLLPSFPRDGDNVLLMNYYYSMFTTHELWLGTLKSSINHKCSKIMDFLIGSVTYSGKNSSSWRA